MARLALSTVGAVIGGIYGGPAGARIGWMAGSLAGAVLIPPSAQKTEGPRLADFSMQLSQEGAPIPVIYGTVRLAGNVIWSTGITESSRTTVRKTSAKGAKQKVEDTQYYYSASLAVLLCEGEISGVSKMWADGQLIYDCTPSTANIVGAGVGYGPYVVGRAGNGVVRFYLGSETQAADSLIEAHEGAANTPAYRGRAYAVFENYLVGTGGGARIPQFEFEVCRDGATNDAPILIDAWPTPSPSAYEYPCAMLDQGTILSASLDGCTSTRLVHKIRRTSMDGVFLGEEIFDVPLPFSADSDIGDNSFAVQRELDLALLAVRDGGGSARTIWSRRNSPGTDFIYRLAGGLLAWPNDVCAGALSSGDYVYGWQYNSVSPAGRSFVRYERVSKNEYPAINPDAKHINLYDAGIVTTTENVLDAYHSIGADGYIYFGHHGSWASYPGASYHSFFKVDPDTMEIVDYWDLPVGHTTKYMNVPGITTDGDRLMYRYTASYLVAFALNDDHTMTYLGEVAAASDATQDPLWPLGLGLGLTRAGVYSLYDTFMPGTIQLNGIVDDLLDRCGVPVAARDVAALAPYVGGLLLARPMPARGAIETLRAAFPFDLVESGGKLIASLRGAAIPSITITADDVVAEGDRAPIEIIMQQESELPRSLVVRYIDANQDYQIAAQASRRMIDAAEYDATIDLPVAMGSEYAAQLAEITLSSVWAEREKYSFVLPPKYAYLDPADMIYITTDIGTKACRLVRADIGAGNTLTCEATPDLAALYESTMTGNDAGSEAEQALSIYGPMNLQIMDLPPLRDMDDAYAVYAAAAGYYVDYPGGVVLRSADENTYEQVLAITDDATIGYATDALADTARAGRFDLANSVNVMLTTPDGTLSSTTRASLYDGVNHALLGNEIIQFLDVTLESDGSYTLTNLLRGRFGTEHAQATHVQGDRFVLLVDGDISGFAILASDVGALRYYKGVTLDTYAEDALTRTETLICERLKPRSPVHAKAWRDESGDWAFTWTPRVRINRGLNPGYTTAIDETDEQYALDIYHTDGTLLRAATVNDATNYTYTFSMQVDDGYPYGATEVDVDIYQVSSRVGRGHAHA